MNKYLFDCTRRSLIEILIDIDNQFFLTSTPHHILNRLPDQRIGVQITTNFTFNVVYKTLISYVKYSIEVYLRLFIQLQIES